MRAMDLETAASLERLRAEYMTEYAHVAMFKSMVAMTIDPENGPLFDELDPIMIDKQNSDTHTYLTEADAAAFFEAMDKPAQANPALVEGFRRYRTRVSQKPVFGGRP